jgi:hypothetical protein
MESGQMKRESKNAGSIVDVWLRFVNFVESHLENGAKKECFLDKELNAILATTGQNQG